MQYNLPVHIGSTCWIGSSVSILPGVSIGDGSVIGAGAVVTKDIPSGVVAAGNPCRVLREISEYDRQYYAKGRKIDWKELEDERSRYASLDEIFSSSDVIFLHCPLTKETEGIINKENISKMKDGVLIVNNSRGPLVDEAALAEALDSGKVGGAALDVVSSEPISAGNPLLKAKNVIITPHISWASYESRKRLFDIAIGNYESFLSGKSVNVVS